MCKGHKNAILDLKWDIEEELEDDIYSKNAPKMHTCGADKTIITWDSVDFSRVRSYKGHEESVNSIDCAYRDGKSLSGMLASASDDGTVKLWDTRSSKYA